MSRLSLNPDIHHSKVFSSGFIKLKIMPFQLIRKIKNNYVFTETGLPHTVSICLSCVQCVLSKCISCVKANTLTCSKNFMYNIFFKYHTMPWLNLKILCKTMDYTLKLIT